MKYYVVWRGKQPGIYDNWPDCQAQVLGFAGAAYKSFKTEAEARDAFARPAHESVAQPGRKPSPMPIAGASPGVGAAVPGNVVSASGEGNNIPEVKKNIPGEIQIVSGENQIIPEKGKTIPGIKNPASATAAPQSGEAIAGPRPVNAMGQGGMPVNPPDWRNDTVLPLPPEVEAQAWAVDAACSGNPGRMEYRGIDLRTGAVVFHFGPIFGTNNIGEFLAIVHALALMKKNGTKVTIYSDSRNAILWVKKGKCNTKLVQCKKAEPIYNLIARAEAWLAANGTGGVKIKKWETSRWGEIPADFGRK